MTKSIFHNKKVIALALVSAITVISVLCSHPSHTELLSHVDSLLVKNESQQALNSLLDMDKSEFNKRDQAYYNMLLTQAKYKNHINATSDSCINEAVSYYSKSEDSKKYTSSLVYQGLVNEELGNYDKAVQDLKDAKGCCHNTVLAYILTNQLDKAKAAAHCMDPKVTYLKAVIAARQGNMDEVKTLLDEVAKADKALAERATKDVEFAEYFK